jgi:hypothetical protein
MPYKALQAARLAVKKNTIVNAFLQWISRHAPGKPLSIALRITLSEMKDHD